MLLAPPLRYAQSLHPPDPASLLSPLLRRLIGSSSPPFSCISMHPVHVSIRNPEPFRGVNNLASSGYWHAPSKRHSVASRAAFAGASREPLRSVNRCKTEALLSRRSAGKRAFVQAFASRGCGFSSGMQSSSFAEEQREEASLAHCEQNLAERGGVPECTSSSSSASVAGTELQASKGLPRQEQAPLLLEDTVSETTSKDDSTNVAALVVEPLKSDTDADSLEDCSVRKSTSESLASRARNRSDRRRKGSLFARNVQGDVPDLLTVPGIGPRNMEKLVAKGIGKVEELKQLYRNKFLNVESSKMVEYLQSSVGIVHKNHAESITSFVKHSVDEEEKAQTDSDKENITRQNKKVTICVEGNISVGKTTFLQKIANEIIELRDLVEIVPEPVDKWKDVGPDHFNLLNAFYNEPERYAYTFQNYVFATRLMQEQETGKGLKPLRLMERSIFSDRLVFVRAIHEAKWMSELELRIYESWFDPFISALPGLVPDGFIYLRASPDTCLQRLHMRNRPEEQAVTLQYLRGLHEKHEQCFFPAESSGGVFSVSQWPAGPCNVPPPPRIRDRMFYLEGDHLHSSIRKVPALVLDCEATIDFNRDCEARAEYAQQVAEFYEYIQSNKDFGLRSKDHSGTLNPLILSHSNTGHLLGPDGSSILHGGALNSFDFTRHSSALMR